MGKPEGLVQALREQSVMSMPIRAALWISGCGDHLLSYGRVIGDGVLGREFGAIAGSFDDELVGSVGQTIQRAIAEDWVVE